MAKAAKSSGWFINLMAFIAVILIGVSLILSRIHVLGQVASAFLIIANVVAYLVVAVVSFFFIARKKNVWLWVVWIASIVLIVVSYVIR